MNGTFDWSSLQVFLVLAREERLTAAARRAGMDHATLKRRITSLEEQLGTMLFERTPWGYVLTPAGQTLVTIAEEMESVSLKLAGGSLCGKTAVEGIIRIVVPDVFGQRFLAAHIGRLIDSHPALEVQLVTTPRSVDLSKREADIAITGQRPEHGRLHSLKLTDYELGLYATQAYLDQAPPIRTCADLRRQRLIGYIDELVLAPEMKYLANIDPGLRPRIRSTTASTQITSALADAGAAVLPCWLAREEPRLIRLLPDDIAVRGSLWLVFNSDMREVASIRAACDFIQEVVLRHRAHFLPHRSSPAPVVELSSARSDLGRSARTTR